MPPLVRIALNQAGKKYGISLPECVWLASALVARRAWEDFAWRGYGLYNVSKTLGYEFNHHDALEAAIDRSSMDLEGWIQRVKQPIDLANAGQAIKRESNPEGALYGEVLVFTGALLIPRREAADMAAKIGCQVASGVTKTTTI